MLSQLSYSPFGLPIFRRKLVGLGRFELPTSPLSGVRSNQLSYRPENSKAGQAAQRHPQQNAAKKTEQLLGSRRQQAGSRLSSGIARINQPRKQVTCEDARASVMRRPGVYLLTLKGGDPAARSRTATLLRLHPSH